MAGLGIADIENASKRFRPSVASSEFESKKAAAKEDQRRLKGLRRRLQRIDRLDALITANELQQLISDIERALTPASSVYMRKRRNRIAGQLWAAIADIVEEACTFTLVPRSWRYAGGQLHDADPTKLLGRLRSALIRAGFNGKKGWLIVVVHGEHEPTADEFVLHVHGLAVGSARAAIDRLRNQREFRSRKSERKSERVARRVRMSRTKLTDLPDPLSYIVQSFWPERPAFENSRKDWKRQRRKRRIKGPRHAEVLEWLNRWSLGDTCLMMGIRVTRNGFRATRQTYTNGDGQ